LHLTIVMLSLTIAETDDNASTRCPLHSNIVMLSLTIAETNDDPWTQPDQIHPPPIKKSDCSPENALR